MNSIECNLCGEANSSSISIIKERPALETDYKIPADKYYREIRHCLNCDVYFNNYDFSLIPSDFYSGYYNDSILQGKLQERFERIINIPFEQSDNKQRVKRIADFFSKNENKYGPLKEKKALDIGTGTGVFVNELKEVCDNVYCVDPDKNSIELVRENNLVKEAWVGSVDSIPAEYTFDFISFNKVLEHVLKPIELLSAATTKLQKAGIIYIELPYAEALITEKLQEERAEFFIEHYTTFTRNALTYLADKSGLKIMEMNTIVEPSNKQTIYAFATK